MEPKWNDLDAETLKIILDREQSQLKAALIAGSSWEDLKEQRLKVTELSIALHKKTYASPHPAESMDRTAKRVQR